MAAPAESLGLHDFAQVFDAWVVLRQSSSRGLSEPTGSVQRAMWLAFGAWCGRVGVHPAGLTVGELAAFLSSREGAVPASELTPRYAWRLLTLVDRVLRYWGSEQGWPRSLAATELLASDFELQYANRESQDPSPEVLSEAQDQTLIAFLTASCAAPVAAAGAGLRWQDVRNRTGVALQRGAGLTPLELRLLTVASVCVDADPLRGAWQLRVPATGTVQAHEAPLAKWARPIVAVWLQRRADELLQGDWLLPSTRTGKPWGKTSQFDSVAEVLEAAGLTGFKGGSYVLRNTFAVRQLARPKVTPETVADWMGIDVREMARYQTN